MLGHYSKPLDIVQCDNALAVPLWIVPLCRYSPRIPRGTCFEMGLAGPVVLTQAIRLRGIMRRLETRQDADRMSEIAQCLPVASTKTPREDKGATTRRFPAAEAA